LKGNQGHEGNPRWKIVPWLAYIVRIEVVFTLSWQSYLPGESKGLPTDQAEH
jgi:hypothetical protein